MPVYHPNNSMSLETWIGMIPCGMMRPFTSLSAKSWRARMCFRAASWCSGATLPIPSPTTLGPNIPHVLFPRSLGGNSPPRPWACGGENLPLACGSADSFALRANHYLHHGPPRPHTRPRTHTTPLHTTTLHSHLLPAHTAAPRSHLCFGCKQPAWGVPLGLASVFAKDSVTLHIHTHHSIKTCTHPARLGKVYKRALVVPPSSPHQRAFVCGACTGTAQIGVSLVSLF